MMVFIAPKNSINYMDSKLASFYKNTSLFSFVLMQPSMLVDEIITNIGLSQKMGFILLVANLIMITAVSYRRIKINHIHRVLLSLFITTTLYLVFIELTMDYTWGISTAIKNLLFACIMIFIVNDRKFNIERLTNYFINVAFVLSLLSLMQYGLYLLNIYHLKIYTYNTYAVGYVVPMGFGGFADTDSWGYYYRNQSFFIEPARYAQFLIVPLLLSLHKYMNAKNKSNLFIISIIFIAFIITYSVANYFGLMFALTLVFLSLKKEYFTSRYRTIYRAFFLSLSILIIIMGVALFNYTESHAYYFSSGNILGKNTINAVIDRLDRIDFAFSAIQDNFFGNRELRSWWSKNPGALGNALIIGGIPLGILCLLYSGYFYAAIIKAFNKGQFYLIYAGSLALFLPFNWYGIYYEKYYLFHIILLLAYVNYQNQQLESEKI
jgi:hypothetical protein